MRIFITGATGFIGSAAVDELLGAGHEVVGLARSDEGAASLSAKGASPLRGDLDDLGALRRGAAESDASLHLGNKHDWANQAATNATERTAVETIAETLAGSDRPFALASGLGFPVAGRAATEGDPSPAVGADSMRGGSENLALDYADRGVRAIALRFAPTVHGMGDHGFISLIADAARRQGVSGYVDDGSVPWSAVHRTDAARLVRLALEQAAPGATVVHAVAEESVSTRDIAEALGGVLDLPTASVPAAEVADHFGFIGRFFAMPIGASSALTRERFGWTPLGPTLIEDIGAGAYSGG